MPTDLLAVLRDNNDIPDQVNARPVQPFVDDSGFMDQFLSEVETIHRQINQISTTVTTIKSKYSALLSAPSPDSKTQSEVDELSEGIKQTASQIRGKLKKMDAAIKEMEETDPTSTEARIRKTQHTTVSRKFLDVLNHYNQIQMDYRDKNKSRYKTQLEIAKVNMTEEEVEQLLQTGKPQIFTQGVVADTQQAKQNLADIEARHQSLLKLEQSIRELHELFIDMGSLVETQGTLINQISHNVSLADDFVKEAKIQTSQAVVLNTKVRKKKFIIGGIFIGILAVVVIIIVVTVVPKS